MSAIRAQRPPFDSGRLDELMGEAGLDVILATSKHNVQYLLGGYRFIFFEAMDAIGLGRYLPVFVYVRGRPDACAYIGNAMEAHEQALGRFWTPTAKAASWSSADAMDLALEHVRGLSGVRRIGVEPSFLPSDADAVLRARLANASVESAVLVLESLRAVKSPHELSLLRQASDKVVEAMLATFAECRPGRTKREMVEALRRHEAARGLGFDYCLMTAGTSLNRAPSDQTLAPGDIISLDSGGNFHGYIGDLCRMGIIGEPDAELVELLGVIEEVQAKARAAARPGAKGGEIYAAAEPLVQASPHRPYLDFLAHGMGLVSHEAPRLTASGPVPYPATHAQVPLAPGMVVSIETTMLHPRRGFIKLEDTVAITAAGNEGFGDAGRTWNRCGG